jgi:hypothetical protein
MTLRMSTDPATPTRPPAPTVFAVVPADDADLLGPCLEAIAGQVYGPAKVFVVGGGDDVRRIAGDFEGLWRPNLRALYDALDEKVDYIWTVRQRARPEPGALAALVQDASRVDASVAGSKVVDSEDSELLVSVGYATDVFNAPYSGLQAGELDQAQFDVIRDVSAVADTSMLIRHDLYRGLGGVDPSMSPTAAAIDFCQRARLRGGRVVVVPSSVVRYQGPDPAPRWKERAGETRAMIKAYSPLTLAWAIPVAFLVGLVESVLGLFVGRFALPGLLAAGVWNVIHLPSALRARFQARRGRSAGDEELFRYQVNGSARLRLLWDDVLDRVRRRFPEGILSGFSEAVEAGQQRIRNPAFFVGLIVIAFGLVATREIWTERLPIVGFSLPPPESPVAALGAYSGGWNPAGLGSPEVLRPHVAATALVQFVTFGSGGAAVAVISVASFVGGAFGMSRLLRNWGIGSTPGYLAGLTLMAGPGLAAITGDTHWTAIPAIALLPWALAQALSERRSRWGLKRLAAITLAVGVAAAFSPATLPVALAAMLLWSVLGVGNRGRPLLRVAVATALAIPLLMPWVLYEDLPSFFSVGTPAFWSPSVWIVGFAALAAAGIVLTPDRVLGAVGVWGAVLAALGAVVARSGDLGGGREAAVVGLAAVALGLALLVGAGLEAGARRMTWDGLGATAARVALLGSLALVLSTFAVLGPGRGGLPSDALSEPYAFAETNDGTATRMLVFGPEESLPGTARSLEGLGYRLIVPPYPATWDAYLNQSRLGDEALHDLLLDLLDGRVRRAGEELAAFGVGWIVFTEPSPLEVVFEAQLDLVPLRSLDFPVFRNEVAAHTAVSGNEVPWIVAGTGFTRPDESGSTVLVASNADYRWGPGEWSQVDWRSRIRSAPDEVRFSGYTPRRMMAIASGTWLLVLFAAVWFFRPRNEVPL